MPFIPHTDADIRSMLETIGAPDIDALFEEIPAALRPPGLPGVPPALTEMEVGRLMGDIAARDGRPLNFIGAGANDHHVPAHYGVHTKDWKLIYYYGKPLGMKGAQEPATEPDWELFDMKRDPREMKNLYRDPAHAGTVRKLKAELERLQKECGDRPA